MKKVLVFFAFGLLLAQCKKEDLLPSSFPSVTSNATTLTKPEHIIFIWFENKGFTSIIGSFAAPYMNSLVARGTLFTNSYALSHPSYGNYIAWFSGSQQGVTSDACITGTPKTGTTIYNSLAASGVDMRWYSEGLPSIGSDICVSGSYVEKHNPTTIFSQVPIDKNRPFSLLDASLKDSTKFAAMPKVIAVTPNMANDMHDGTIQAGDAWLKLHFAKFIDYAIAHNSIVVIYFDESETSKDNRIPVIMVGQHITPSLKIATLYNHYSFAKFTLGLYGANTSSMPNINNAVTPTGFWR